MKLTLLLAITLDGKIAKNHDHFPNWSASVDKKFFAQKTKAAGCVIMGNTTFKTIKKPLPKRHNIILTYDKNKKSIWDNLVYTNESPSDILEYAKKKGFNEVFVIGGTQINTLFLKANLINEIIVTISPLIFGKGLSMFSNDTMLSLILENHQVLGENTIALTYKIKK